MSTCMWLPGDNKAFHIWCGLLSLKDSASVFSNKECSNISSQIMQFSSLTAIHGSLFSGDLTMWPFLSCPIRPQPASHR